MVYLSFFFFYVSLALIGVFNSALASSDDNQRHDHPINHDSKSKPQYKRQGQEEFPTFVDPIPNPSLRKVEARMAVQSPKFTSSDQKMSSGDISSTIFIAVATVCSAAAVFGLVGAGVCWHRLQKQRHSTKEAEYPKYGVTGPARERTSGTSSPVAAMDAKLASSAQLYHYQHTKQQIIAMEQSSCETKGNESEDSECEGDEGNYSVYECPGLAPTGDIEVSNPLFEHASPVSKTDPRRDQAGVHHRSFE
jgi:hypothetical protein